MTIAMWAMIVVMFFYSTLYAVSLWKDHNKTGSLLIMIFAIFIAVGPYFIIFK